MKVKTSFRAIELALSVTYAASKFLIALYAFLMVVASALPLVSIYFLNLLITFLAHQQFSNNVLYCIAGIVCTSALQYICSSACGYMKTSITEKGMLEIRKRTWEKLIDIPLSFIDSSRGKDILSSVNSFNILLPRLCIELLDGLAQFCGFVIAAAAIIKFSPFFGILAIALSFPAFIFDGIFQNKTYELNFEQIHTMRLRDYYASMLTKTEYAKDIRMYNLTEPIKRQFWKFQRLYRDAIRRLEFRHLLVSIATELCRRGGEAIFTVHTIMLAADGNITIGNIALYIGYVLSANKSLSAFVHDWFDNTLFSIKRVKEQLGFFQYNCEDVNENGCKLDKFESLVFKDVYFKYPGSENYVLKGLSFDLKRGEKMSLVGVNGAGKSTVIKLMIGLYPIDSGQILLNGHPLQEYKIADVRKLFSVLFQNYVQYPLTLSENIGLSDLKNIKDDVRLMKATQKSKADELWTRQGCSADTSLTRQFDDNGVELSKGQWQKVAMARAFFKEADILVFDEPSSALDAESEDRVLNNFAAMSAEQTGILISHRISGSKICNKVIVINEGVVSESGTHEQLLKEDKLYAQMYNMQRDKYVSSSEG